VSGIDLSATMDAIANELIDAGVVTRAYPYPVESVQPPCVVVAYPEAITFDLTFGRGADVATYPVYFITGLTTDKTARDALSDILAGVGSIKATLDGDLGGVVQSARVTDASVESVTVAGVTYIAAKFNLEVIQ